MKLNFVIDGEYDIQTVLGLKETGYLKEEITRESLKERYKGVLPDMKRKQKEYQDSWDDIGERFSDYVEKTTGYNWFYPEYTCVLSVAARGVSNWGHEPKILRFWGEDPKRMLRITAHELILSHYFEIYRMHYREAGLKDGQVWALAEIAAFALTSLTKEAKEFWPGNAEYYTNHNYPHIVELQKELGKVFLGRKDFDEYIKKGIELVRKYPNMNPSGINSPKVRSA